MPLRALPKTVTETAEIPVHDGQAAVEQAYAEAEREGVPFVAIERYEEGYAFTYDLLPAGERLTPANRDRVQSLLTTELETIVGDSDSATTEAAKSVNDSLGQVSLFASESEARQIAEAVVPVVLNPDNWAGD
jgi:hypothetical protein